MFVCFDLWIGIAVYVFQCLIVGDLPLFDLYDIINLLGFAYVGVLQAVCVVLVISDEIELLLWYT